MATDTGNKSCKKSRRSLRKEEDALIEKERYIRNFKIVVEKIEHIVPAFSATDVYMEVKHSETILGQSERTVVHEKENVLLDYEIDFSYNIKSNEALDELLSCPIYFTVWQAPGQSEIHLYPSRSETSEDTETLPITRGSISSLYEAILGVKLEEPSEELILKSAQKVKIKKGEDKKIKEKKEKVKDKDSSHSSKKIKKEETINTDLAAPVFVGCSNLDLLPLFLGKTEIYETIPLYQETVVIDDELVTLDNLPQLTVKIKIDKPLFGEVEGTKKLVNLLNITVESIYSLPEYFGGDLSYTIATILPTQHLTMKSVCIENGVYREGLNVVPEFKLWPKLATVNNFSANTCYKIDENTSKLKNKIGASLSKETLKIDPRVTWNILKKCWLTENGTDFLEKNIVRYRHWPIEIFLSIKDKRIDEVGKKGKDKSSNASKESKKSRTSVTGSKKIKRSPLNPELRHLMGFVDISKLLYPGVTKTRVMCELRTFQQKELAKETGFNNSYFQPKKIVEVPEPGASEDKIGKADKKGTDKASKVSNKSGKVTKKGNAKTELEEDPSQQMFSEKGEPTFMILEFELLKPFRQRRTIQDLSFDLQTIIPKRDNDKPSVMNMRFATEFYRETILKLAITINKEFQTFSKPDEDVEIINFIKYLQRTGIYQKLYSTFARAVIVLVKEKFNYNNDFKNTIAYVNYVSNVYTYLQNILNSQIHNLISCNLPDCNNKQSCIANYMYLQKEALENEAITLAERYHIQALDADLKNPNLWFNFSVFHLHIQNVDKAFECLKESLAIQSDHRYSLLLFGIILFEKSDFYLSEVTFLSLVSYHPRFLEAWVCLYIFYMKRQQFEGCDFCLDMLSEHKDSMTEMKVDYVLDEDGLSWTTKLCKSDNVFYQTAILLIKLKALKFADIALSTNNFIQDGSYKYYQGVILYFAKDYEHALMHLADAQKMHGPDYPVNSLIGHCHYRLGNYKEAKEAYMFVVEAFNRPDDMHMLYMNLSFILEAEKKYNLARKYMVYVCKYSPTPYSWLMLGILYYKTNNFKYAEACLEESNLLDIRLPETWAYLVLLNIKFGKHWEAEQCYTQMLRFCKMIITSTTPEILEAATATIINLLPLKYKQVYKHYYQQFISNFSFLNFHLRNDVLLSEVQSEMQKIHISFLNNFI